jgi:hypothetical protein
MMDIRQLPVSKNYAAAARCFALMGVNVLVVQVVCGSGIARRLFGRICYRAGAGDPTWRLFSTPKSSIARAG